MAILTNLIHDGQEYTIRTSREIRTRCNELEYQLPGLFSSPNKTLQDVLKELERQEARQNETLRRLEQSFEGNPLLIANLKKALPGWERANGRQPESWRAISATNWLTPIFAICSDPRLPPLMPSLPK